MNSELKAYLDKLRAETKACYDAWDKRFELDAPLLAHLTIGASTPPVTRSAVVASDGDRTVDATAVAVVPDASSSTAKTQETFELIPVTSPAGIETVPVTCSTECSTQLIAVTNVGEVHDIATTVYSAPTVESVHQEAEQLTSSSTTAGMTRAADLDIVSVHVGEMPLRPEALFKVTRERQVLRPMPWPSFLNDQAAHGPAPYHSDNAIAKTHEAKHIGKPFLWSRPDSKLKNLHAMWLLIERILGWSLYLLGSVKMSTDKQDVPFNIVCLRFQLGVFAVHLSGGNSLCLCHYTAAIGDTWYVSGSSSSDSMTFGSKEVQIVRLLTNIYCCNTTKSEVIHGNLSSSLNIMVMWYLDHGFMRIKKWWLDIHCSQLVNESFEASFWPEQHIIGNYLQVLVTDSLLQLFWSGSTPSSTTQVVAIPSIHEISAAAAAVFPEPAVDFSDKEAEQLTPVMIKVDHSVAHIVSNNLAAPVLTACPGHDVQIVVESKGMLMPPSPKRIEPQPWPSPIEVQIAENVVVLPHGIPLGYFIDDDFGNVWWPPDQQPRMRSKLQEWHLPTQLQTLFFTLLDMQPWPSWKFHLTQEGDQGHVIKLFQVVRLLSTKAFYLLLDKRCLKCHIVNQEINPKILQPSGIQCEPQTVYLEFDSAQAHLKLNAVCDVVSLISSIERQPWPSGQLTFGVSTERSNCCEAGPKRMEINTLFVFCNYSEQFPWKVAWSLTFERKKIASMPCLMHNFQFPLPSYKPLAVQVWYELPIVVQEQIRQLAWCSYLDKFWRIRDLAYRSQEQRKIYEQHVLGLEYVVIDGIPIPDKLQGTMQIMGMSAHWQFLSQEEFKGSGRSEFQSNSVMFATLGLVKRLSELKPLNVVAWSDSLILSAAHCVFGAVLSGYQSSMPHHWLTQGMQQHTSQNFYELRWSNNSQTNYMFICVIRMLWSDLGTYLMDMSCDSGSSATYCHLQAMNSSSQDCPQALIVMPQFKYGLLPVIDLYLFQYPYCGFPCIMSEAFKSEGVQSNELCAVKLVLPAVSSCEQWDPGGLNFADVQGLQVPCSIPQLVDCTLHMLRLVFTMKHSYELAENWHRLEGKPVVKGEGMSASLLSWADRYGLGPPNVAPTGTTTATTTNIRTEEPEKAIQWITARQRRLSSPSSAFSLY